MKSRQGSGRKDRAKTRELLDAKPRISETHESCECTIHDRTVADMFMPHDCSCFLKAPFHESLEHRLTRIGKIGSGIPGVNIHLINEPRSAFLFFQLSFNKRMLETHLFFMNRKIFVVFLLGGIRLIFILSIPLERNRLSSQKANRCSS